jgi:hypothetical protein
MQGHVVVQCIPITTLLLALNKREVDYFSLDVEGNELEVLRTIDFDKINIKVYCTLFYSGRIVIIFLQTLSVEFIHGKEGKEEIRKFMDKQGYVVHSEVVHPEYLANDFIFVKKSENVPNNLS